MLRLAAIVLIMGTKCCERSGGSKMSTSIGGADEVVGSVGG